MASAGAGNARALARCRAGVLMLAAAAWVQPVPAQEEKDNVAGPYVPTPWEIVHEMLKLSDVAKGDTLYDLGSGDGRLVITAAKRHGAKGVGVELQPQLVDLAHKNAQAEGVAERVKFLAGDLFEADVSGASIVTLYLLPRFVTRLVPKLRAELSPGARIVSHDYPLSPWAPDKTLTFDVAEKQAISGTTRTVLYYYVVPARVAGNWALAVPRSVSPRPITLKIAQEPDRLEGSAQIGGDAPPLRELVLRSDAISFSLLHGGRLIHFKGTVTGREMAGEVRAGDLAGRWSGKLVTP
ncbi:MAG: methyltransferase domain-containing protein [Betaproteobacteria bacterium]|nr:methyltransferase domain-containing protein [Betaproteobacteria bacterium]